MKKIMLVLGLVLISGASFAVCNSGFMEYTGTEYVVVDGACPEGYETVYTNSEVPANYTGGTAGSSSASSCVFGS